MSIWSDKSWTWLRLFFFIGLAGIFPGPVSGQSCPQPSPAVDVSSSSYTVTGKNPYAGSYRGQCTWYAWGRARQISPNASVRPSGNANEWCVEAGLPCNTEPRANSFAIWDDNVHGHVAYVERVDGNTIYFTEANVKSFTGVSSNIGGGYTGGDACLKSLDRSRFEQRTLKNGNPPAKFLGYIYIDQSLPAIHQLPVPSQHPGSTPATAPNVSTRISLAAPPVLQRVTPDSRPTGTMSVDLYGGGFQRGAKVIAQGKDWKSDHAAVTYIGPDHLRIVIVAQNPAEFTLAVQNPDMQESAAQRFQVTHGGVNVTPGNNAPTQARPGAGTGNSLQGTSIQTAPPKSSVVVSTNPPAPAVPVTRSVPQSQPPLAPGSRSVSVPPSGTIGNNSNRTPVMTTASPITNSSQVYHAPVSTVPSAPNVSKVLNAPNTSTASKQTSTSPGKPIPSSQLASPHPAPTASPAPTHAVSQPVHSVAPPPSPKVNNAPASLRPAPPAPKTNTPAPPSPANGTAPQGPNDKKKP